MKPPPPPLQPPPPLPLPPRVTGEKNVREKETVELEESVTPLSHDTDRENLDQSRIAEDDEGDVAKDIDERYQRTTLLSQILKKTNISNKEELMEKLIERESTPPRYSQHSCEENRSYKNNLRKSENKLVTDQYSSNYSNSPQDPDLSSYNTATYNFNNSPQVESHDNISFSNYDSGNSPRQQKQDVANYPMLNSIIQSLSSTPVEQTFSVPKQSKPPVEDVYFDPLNPAASTEPIVTEPQSDLRAVIDRLAEYVAKNGEEFEAGIKEKEDPRFDFLNAWNIYHPYYMQRKEFSLEQVEKQKKLGNS